MIRHLAVPNAHRRSYVLPRHNRHNPRTLSSSSIAPVLAPLTLSCCCPYCCICR